MRAPTLFFCLLLAALCSCSKEPETPRAKNVLLVVVDTLRADRLGCYGYERDTSPTIDALAERGTLFENCYSQACWTVPSMISMMSGVYVTEEESALPEKMVVLAEALQAQGIETAAFPANMTLSLERGFERGFDHFQPIKDLPADDVQAAFATWFEGKRADAERAEQPFFAWVQLMDPHFPYNPADEHRIFEGVSSEGARLKHRWREEEHRLASLSPELEPVELRKAIGKMHRIRNAYDGEVHQADAGIADIFETLRAAGVLDDTLIILAADHGEMLYEHPHEPLLVESIREKEGGLPNGVRDLFGSGHRSWYYDDLWNTPLILAGPGIPAGLRRQGLAANLDIYPTILEALDLPPLPGLQGTSLFEGREVERERLFAYGHGTSAVIETGGTKMFVHPPELYLLDESEAGQPKLYDLSEDPDELRDLRESQPAEVERLTSLIEQWKSENRREVINTTSDAQRKILEDLGYVGDGMDFSDKDEDEASGN